MVTEDHGHCVMPLANNFANKKDVSVGLLPVTRSGPNNRRKLLYHKDVVKLDFRKKHHYETVLFYVGEKFSELALGLMLLTFGLWLLFDRSNLLSVLFSSGENQLVAYISCLLVGIGSVITFTSAVGFLGSVVEVKCLLVTYMSFQILVFVTQMVILVLILLKKEEVHNQWNNRIDEVISEYGNESLAEQIPAWNILNAVQHNPSLIAFMISLVINGDLNMSMVWLDYVLEYLNSVLLNSCGNTDFSKATCPPPTMMECCGRYNVTQWERNKTKGNSTQIPCSCTKSSLKKWFCDIPRDSTYSMGCEEYLNTWFENNVLILTAITVSLLITQIFLMTLTGQLFRNTRKKIWPNEA